ncbi:CWF19-like protein 1 [Halichondria panicea]|uniref:CWF19-like protein 1 n=1 Tax=Halichondria panicea TaxID=6063 RepID=UPI00312B89EE
MTPSPAHGAVLVLSGGQGGGETSRGLHRRSYVPGFIQGWDGTGACAGPTHRSLYAASTDAPPEVLEELGKFKSALRKYFNSKDQSCVIFERNYKSQHLQLQVIPVTKILSDALRQALIDYGRSMGVWLETVPRETPPSELAYTGVPYFLAEFNDGKNVFTRPFSHQLTQTNNQITEYRL